MRYDSYDRDRQRAHALGRTMTRAGSAARVGHGRFIPRTDPSTWDERHAGYVAAHPYYVWREEGLPQTHYWVEAAGAIHDISADQFGEPAGFLVVEISDPRYKRFGTTEPMDF